MYRFCVVILLLTSAFIVQSAPWINASNLYLRADIQLLSDHHFITAPVNHWPLNWSDIAADLLRIDSSELPDNLKMSYRRVMFYYREAKQQNVPSTLRLSIASDTPEFQSFGSEQREKLEISTEKSFTAGDFAFGLGVQQTNNASDGNNTRFENSYIAYKLGNWNLTAGVVPMWWGPGWDSSLSMSNNARPLPGISLNRQQAVPFENKWLSWLGPWSFTTFMGQFEANRHIANAHLWSSRFSFRPLKNLEWGFTRSTMWGGDGQRDGWSGLINMIIPSESKNKTTDKTDNLNDLASVDFRYNTSIFNHSVNFNYQMGFEDYASIMPSKRSYLFGFDTNIFYGDSYYKLFMEASATYLNTCKCIYRHSIYQSGYSYKGRVIGSTYAYNAQALVFGVIAQPDNDSYWQSKFAYIERNLDHKHDSFNASFDSNYDEIYQLDTKYRWIFMQAQWDFGVILRHTKNNKELDNTAEISLTWQYKL